MPSFDVVSEINMVELVNSVAQANKEVTNRFDFKGSDARIEQQDLKLIIFADDDFKLSQVKDVLINKLTKRGIDTRVLEPGILDKISGNKIKETVGIKNGIEQTLAKKIVKLIKDNKLKVQASIQGETLRITGTKRDDLQLTIEFLKKEVNEIPLQFNNFRD